MCVVDVLLMQTVLRVRRTLTTGWVDVDDLYASDGEASISGGMALVLALKSTPLSTWARREEVLYVQHGIQRC